MVVFCDDSTAVHSLRKGGAPGLLSSTPWLRRSCARWSPSPSACLPSSFRAPTTVLTDSLSRPRQLTHPRVVFTHDRLSVFEKTVAGSNVFFATSATHRGSIYFSPFRDPWSAGHRTRFSRSGTAFGLTRSLRWLSSAYYHEAPGIHGDGTHSCDSPLG